MTTTGIESWAVDLATVGAVYPLQGLEWLMLIVGLVTWIGWHVWCMRWENEPMKPRSASMAMLHR